MPTSFGFGIRLNSASTSLGSQTFNAAVNNGDPIYFDGSMWQKADVSNLPKGVRQDTNIVILGGKLTAPSAIFISDRFYYMANAGGITLTRTSTKVGKSISTTELLVDIDSVDQNLLGKAGYISGGNTGAVSNSIEKLRFLSDIRFNITSNLTVAIQNSSGSNSNLAGYISGGDDSATPTPINTNSIDKLTFTSESRSALTSVLSVVKSLAAGFESDVSAFVLSGSESSIQRLIFTNDNTNIVSGILLSANRFNITDSGYNSKSFGYVSGGQTPVPTLFVSTIDKFNFSTETNASSGTNLSISSELGISYESSSTGYYIGGLIPTPLSTLSNIEKINFSNDSNSISNINLSITNRSATGFNSTLNGYIAGGFNGSVLNSFNGLLFSSDFNSNILSTLIAAKFAATGFED